MGRTVKARRDKVHDLDANEEFIVRDRKRRKRDFRQQRKRVRRRKG